jgi:hypothetical protein
MFRLGRLERVDVISLILNANKAQSTLCSRLVVVVGAGGGLQVSEQETLDTKSILGKEKDEVIS